MVHYLPAPAQLIYIVLGAIFVLQGVWHLCHVRIEPAARRRAGVAAAALQRAARHARAAPARDSGPHRGLVDGRLLRPRSVHAWSTPSSVSTHRCSAASPCSCSRRAAGVTVLALRHVVCRVAPSPSAQRCFSSAPRWSSLRSARIRPGLFFVGTALAGIGFGAGFQGALRSVVMLAAPAESAGVLAILFVISYLAMGVPAIIAGWAIVETGNIPGHGARLRRRRHGARGAGAGRFAAAPAPTERQRGETFSSVAAPTRVRPAAGPPARDRSAWSCGGRSLPPWHGRLSSSWPQPVVATSSMSRPQASARRTGGDAIAVERLACRCREKAASGRSFSASSRGRPCRREPRGPRGRTARPPSPMLSRRRRCRRR